jgi:hypothetical protein
MGQRFFIFLVVHLLLLNGEIIAQGPVYKTQRFSIGWERLPKTSQLNIGKNYNSQGINFFSGQNFFKNSLDFGQNPVLSGNFYFKQLSFFCRSELKIENAIALPLRFRLGSLEYVNFLEGKPNSNYYER